MKSASMSLIVFVFLAQMGEKNWQNLSERERQRKLMEMKLKERQLRRDGKYDELAALLGMNRVILLEYIVKGEETS